MKKDHAAHHPQDHKADDRHGKPEIQAPWPDQEARQEMSDAAAERDNLGKHGKNPGWEKKW